MNKTIDIELPEYFAKHASCDTFQDELLIAELDHSICPEDKVERYPIRLKASSLILVLSGEMDIEVNYLQHILKKNATMQLFADDIIQNVSYSSDFKGYLIVFSSGFRAEIMSLTSGVRLQKAGQLKRAYPIQELGEGEFLRLEGHVKRIISYIADKSHLYRAAIIKNEVMNLFFNLDNSRWKQHGDGEFHLNQGELLRERFWEMLVEKCKEHREVGYYARELCVTPDYLSRIIREYDGQSAIKWINNAVITEAKFLLRQSGKTVNQIAMELNFPDQSTFGKFFKRYAGISPVDFRKSVFTVG